MQYRVQRSEARKFKAETRREKNEERRSKLEKLRIEEERKVQAVRYSFFLGHNK